MELTGSSAIVTGGASGIGAAVARRLAAQGATVVVADLQADKGEALADEIGGVFAQVDVTETEEISAAVNAAAEIAPLRAVVDSAGIGWAQRTIGRDGTIESAHDLGAFTKVIQINLIGTFDMVRQAATAMSHNEPDEDGCRGSIVNLASVAAFDGRIDHHVVFRFQGRRGRHDPAGRPRPVRGRHPPQHRRSRPDRHPDLRRGAGLPRPRSRPSSARACCIPSASASPTSWPAWSSSA